MNPEVESAISEINILPDGRVCVFGALQGVLEILDAIPLDDSALQRRIECLRHAGEQSDQETNAYVKQSRHE